MDIQDVKIVLGNNPCKQIFIKSEEINGWYSFDTVCSAVIERCYCYADKDDTYEIIPIKIVKRYNDIDSVILTECEKDIRGFYLPEGVVEGELYVSGMVYRRMNTPDKKIMSTQNQ